MSARKLLNRSLGIAGGFLLGALAAWAQDGLVVLEGPKVGIGTSSPNAELDVSGDARASGTFEAASLAGSGNAYVCVDADGALFRSDTPCNVDPIQVPEPCEQNVSPFPDVPWDHQFCGAMKWMADTGISTGFPDGTFRPGDAVTRQAMSVFLFRLAHLVPE